MLQQYRIPLILVLTQCYDFNVRDEMISKIEKEMIEYCKQIVDEDYFDVNGINKVTLNGIDDLKTLTNSALSDSFIFNNLDEQVGRGLEETFSLNKINIITIGKSGVSKSTFRSNWNWCPVKQRIAPLTTLNSPLTIYDTSGLEFDLSQQKEFKNVIIELIKKGYKTKDLNKYIHCIWYYISAEFCRFEE